MINRTPTTSTTVTTVPIAIYVVAWLLVLNSIALTACVDGGLGGCDVQSLCAVKGRWDRVNDAIYTALSGITLADMRAASVPLAFRLPAHLAAAAAE